MRQPAALQLQKIGGQLQSGLFYRLEVLRWQQAGAALELTASTVAALQVGAQARTNFFTLTVAMEKPSSCIYCERIFFHIPKVTNFGGKIIHIAVGKAFLVQVL